MKGDKEGLLPEGAHSAGVDHGPWSADDKDEGFLRGFGAIDRFVPRQKLGLLSKPSHRLVAALLGITVLAGIVGLVLGLTLGRPRHHSRPRIEWGLATAAYQVEGAAQEGGRTPSIWDTFSHTPNKTYHNETGDIADDFYHRYKDDVKLLKELKVQYFRFSISWTRIYPTIDGPVNQEGITFYSNLIDTLLAAGIKPVVSLYHWDLPQWSHDAYGGWADKKVVPDFVKFADTCFREFGGRVKHWATFNEPWTFCLVGYGWGIHAPGINSTNAPWICGHNVLLSHAEAVAVYREQYQPRQKGRISIVINIDWAEPFSSAKQDQEAASLRMEVFGSWFADPVFKGDYSPVMKRTLGTRLPTFTAEQRAKLKGSADLFMLNHYSSMYCQHLENPGPDALEFWKQGSNNSEGQEIGPLAESEWLRVVPWGFRKVINWVSERYDRPEIWITENGVDVPKEDSMSLDVVVHDKFRQDFYAAYISNMLDAVHKDGADVRVYLAWSFLDNFEWADGYAKRFGVVYVDFATQQRYPKDSARWLSNFFNGPQDQAV